MHVKENYAWSATAFTCENGKHLAIIMNDSVIICDEVSHMTKLSETAK